ncbi:hypothetical protein BKA93DRAFT_726913 [Sparassis latifolia]
MPSSSKPLSFIARGPLKRAPPELASDDSSRIEPISLPVPKYLPTVSKKTKTAILEEDQLEAYKDDLIWIQGRKFSYNYKGELEQLDWEYRRGPQRMQAGKIPVPNLSKKTHGRSVPTKAMGVRLGRTYTCEVESCRKVFKRSYHLERHIQSVHTHEKPFKCRYRFCQKPFSREDNMLQHLRKHKPVQTHFDCSTNYAGEEMANKKLFKAYAKVAVAAASRARVRTCERAEHDCIVLDMSDQEDTATAPATTPSDEVETTASGEAPPVEPLPLSARGSAAGQVEPPQSHQIAPRASVSTSSNAALISLDNIIFESGSGRDPSVKLRWG